MMKCAVELLPMTVQAEMTKIMIASWSLLFFTLTCNGSKDCVKPKCPEGTVSYCVVNASSRICTGSCFDRQRIPRGYFTTNDGNSGNLNAEPCPVESFQPTNEPPGTKCWCRTKSQCNGTGQIVVHNGSDLQDRTCRCNYKEGYIYEEPPNDICKCLPSEENCHCVLVQCRTGQQLSPEYKCVDVMDLSKSTYKCDSIVDKIKEMTTSNIDTAENQKGENGKSNLTDFLGDNKDTVDVVVFVVVVVAVFCLGLGTGTILERKQFWTLFRDLYRKYRRVPSKEQEFSNAPEKKIAVDADAKNGKGNSVIFINRDDERKQFNDMSDLKSSKKGTLTVLPPRDDSEQHEQVDVHPYCSSN